MEEGGTWPASALWDYAVRLYGSPGVQTACLRLQDEAGADVNLLLLAAWLGATGRELDPHALAAVLETARSWQERVVAPLRAVRRELKTRLADADPALRQPLGATRRQLAEVELASERAQLIILERLAAGCPAGSTDPAIAVRTLGQLGLLASRHEAWVAVLLRAAFPGHNAAGQAAPAPG